jgi:hypothetical protein
VWNPESSRGVDGGGSATDFVLHFRRNLYSEQVWGELLQAYFTSLPSFLTLDARLVRIPLVHLFLFQISPQISTLRRTVSGKDQEYRNLVFRLHNDKYYKNGPYAGIKNIRKYYATLPDLYLSNDILMYSK